MIQIKDYCPIDVDYVKKEWDKIMNVPNDQWNIRGIDKELEVINDDGYPYTLRTIKLNLLPNLIIEILNNQP